MRRRMRLKKPSDYKFIKQRGGKIRLFLTLKHKVSAKGLEPLTNGLKGRCSTIELRAHEECNFITPLI
jgi:hypothetical protein